jgi:transposase
MRYLSERCTPHGSNNLTFDPVNGFRSDTGTYSSLIQDVLGADGCGFREYAGGMRYAQGGGLTAEGRRRREQVRLAAVERFEQRVPAAEIAAELRVTERSVRRWRQAWLAGGLPGLASKGPAARCLLDEQQLAGLESVLEAGPLAAGFDDQRWTLARVRDLVARRFGVQYTIPGVWYLLRRRGWSCQMGARRAIERDDGAIEVWKKETWPQVKGRRRPWAAGSSSRTSPASR